MIPFFLILAFVANAGAVTTTKPVNIDRLADELEAAGCVLTADRAYTIEGVTTINTVNVCDVAVVIAAHVYVDPQLARTRLRFLARKWRLGTITPAEKDELIKAWILRMLGE